MDRNASLIDTLPSELWDRIFSLLTSRKDVMNARLSCRAFKDLSSPYLITSVCFALRIDTLASLYDVMDHPFYHQHVTELIYDTSEFYWRFESLEAYAAALKASELDFERIPSVGHTRLELLHRILRRPIKDEEVRRRVVERISIQSSAVPIVHGQDENGVRSALTVVPLQRSWLGLIEYNSRRAEQISISEWEREAVMLQVFLAFPRLSHVVFGDYRNLALEGEDYHRCCSRLFGREMLPPRIMTDPQPINYVHPAREQVRRWANLFDLVQDSNRIPFKLKLKRLTIGTHKWSVPTGSCRAAGNPSTEIAPMLLFGPKSPDEPTVKWPGVDWIRELSLPVHTGVGTLEGEEDDCLKKLAEVSTRSPLGAFVHAVAPTLRYFDFGAVDLMPAAKDPERQAFELALSRNGRHVLQLLLFHVQFPVLKHLKLSGWVLRPDEFLKFLEPMKPTLEFLELQYNIVEGSEPQRKCSKKLAKEGGAQMSLKGVVIDNYELAATPLSLPEDRTDNNNYNAVGRDSECEGLWLGGKTNMFGRRPVETA